MKSDGNGSFSGCPKSHDCQSLINRRQFIAIGSGCVVGAALGKAAEKPKKKLEPVDVGPLKNYSKDGITDNFADTDGFFVIRYLGSLFAASTRCPHMGHALRVDPNNSIRIICGSHGAVFDGEGLVVVGPATTGLVRLGVKVNDKGNVIVDRNQKFPQDKWVEDGSYVEVK